MLRLRAFLLLPFLALPVIADDPPKAEGPKTEAIGLRRMLASIHQKDNEWEVIVDGEGSLPDGAVIDVSVEHRGQVCEQLRTSISPQGGIFSARMSTQDAFLPGYYVVVAQVSPWRQTEGLAEAIEKVGEIRVTQAITVGTPEEIKATRDEQLKLYEGQLVEMEAAYAKLSQVYQKVVVNTAGTDAVDAFKKECAALPAEYEAKARHLNELFQGKVIPIFPLLHTTAVEGWMNLIKLYENLEKGLTADVDALKGHGATRAIFDKLAKEELTAYVRGMRAQMLMERHLEVRDQVLNVLTQLACLFDESRNTYRQAKEVQTDEIKEFWRKVSGEWTRQLAEIEKALSQIKIEELEKGFPEIMAGLRGTPASLRKLWDLYTQVVVEGAKPSPIPGHERDSVEERLGVAELECWGRIYPLMEVLGFNRDVFNRQMKRTAEMAEDADPQKLISGTMDDYILAQAEKLGSADEQARNQAMQIVLGMKAVSLRVLKKKLDAGVEAGSTMEAYLLIGLGRLGEASVAGRLLALVSSSKEEAIRVSAALAVGSTRAPEALVPLEKLVKEDKMAAVRAAAATALSFLGNPSALDVLIEAFGDADVAVRQSALAAANALAKNEFQYDPKAPEETRKTQSDAAKTWLEQNRSKLGGQNK